MKNKELNTRQWELYHLLKENKERFLKLKTICKLMPEHYKIVGNTEFNNQKGRRLLTMDIQALKTNETIQKVVMSTANGIKLVSQEEFTKIYEKERDAILRRITRLNRLNKKAGLHNQVRLVFNTEREVIEAF